MFGLFAKNRSFHGGLKLEGHKLHGERGRIQAAPLPRKVILPVAQHIGAPAQPLVEVGQRVLRGQCIAASDNFIAAPVHASISGTVTDIGLHEVPHPSGLPALAIVIESDGEDEAAEASWPACEEPLELDANSLRERVRQAGLVGLGGAAFPSAVKLNPGSSARVETLILNGAECEPYISCDAALMSERADEVVAGARLIMRALGAFECLIGIEDNAPEAAAALRQAINRADAENMALRVVPTRYPQGGEKQLIQALTGKEVPREGLPLDIGIVVHNVGTVAAIWRAIRHAQPLISRIVTVNGPGIAQPMNLEVRLGTPVADLIAFCGGYTATPRLIMGGPMMGFALGSDAVPVVKATNCLLVEVAEAEPADQAMPCIRCGECVEVCPARLLPQQLYWHARAREFDKTQDLNLFDCIECGCCAQVCPSQIPLVQYYRYAKTEIYQAEQEKRKADIARKRHEFRLERLEREAQEKEEARRRKREALKQKQAAPPSSEAPASAPAPAANDAIAAAIAKAKAEKARRLAEPSAPAEKADGAGDPVAEAIARAKAAKASKASTSEAPADGATDDPIAAAIAKAKAAKAAKAAASEAPADSSAEADDPVAAAIARAKAAKAAKAAASEAPADSSAEANDPVAAAIAKAKAAKAAKAAASEAPANSSTEADDPVAAAIAKARAAKAAKAAASESPADSSAEADDPVAAAIAKAKAAKAARQDSES